METGIRRFFERYEDLFNRALRGEADMDEIAGLYAAEFIAASPAGVMGGRNDAGLRQAMAQGYARYRAIGTKRMRVRDIRVTPIDGQHCLAHVDWTATYARKDKPDLEIDFVVRYFLQMLAGEPKVFGWVSGDEEALLKAHDIG